MSQGPPSDRDAEQAVLGAALVSAEALREAVEALSPEDFYEPSHELIFRAIRFLEATNRPVDALTVAAELDRRNLRHDRVYLADLVANAGVASNVEHYSIIVREKAVRRQLLDTCTRIAQAANESPDTAEEVVEFARSQFDKLQPSQTTVTSYSDVLPGVVDAMEKGLARGRATGWGSLDNLIHGLQPGKLYVVGSRPSVGKSLIGLQVANFMWEAHNCATYYASLEMTREELVGRSVAYHSRVSLSRIIDGGPMLSASDWAAISLAVDRLHDSQVWIEDGGRQTVDTVRSGARALARRSTLGLVVIDYLQLLAPRDSKVPREQQVADISRSSKLLAKELSIPVLLLAQLNRSSERRADRTPQLADLRESGAIEQDADVVIMPHLPNADDTDNPALRNELDLYVTKNRSGATGVCHFTRQGEFARIIPRTL